LTDTNDAPAPATEVAGPPGAPNGQPGEASAPRDEGLTDLARRFDRIEDQLAAFHRRAAHRESVIDYLHEENQRLQAGMSRAILEPVVADLIRLYDQLDREVRRLQADGQEHQLLWSFGQDVLQILDRCGLESFSAAPGDAFDHERHRPLSVLPCDDEARHNTVAEVITLGFADPATGKIRRPAQARFYRFIGDQGDEGPSSGQAETQ
jgi:molecular chaperone GrpE